VLTDPRDLPVAEFLVGSLDDNGWLRCSVSEVVTALGVEEAQVQRILTLLQNLEPVGIAARDLRECLLIQLTHLESEGQGQRYVRAIITDHFEDLARHYMLPDVIINADAEGSLTVAVVESKRFTLRISPYYQQIWQEVESRGSQVMEKDREHVRQYVGRARRFLANLEQRRQTMQKIGEFVAEYQTDFLLHGVRHLRPLTRAMVAATTGMHESTVSRATAGKYVMIPNGRVIPFGDFFTASLNVKDVIRGMIQQEIDPLDDQEIATRLQDHGHYIARRTVAKYRDELGILPSALRR
jgi:RNA polymerase sigma-54 factor